MAYEFHYTPTGTGVISGKEVLEQTEDAINDLGNTAISGVQEALDKAEQALTNSANAVDDAQTALNTANNAEGVAIQAQNDVSNLSGTVTNIGNRVTTAEGNITNLQGRMTTAEGNITNLQGRMTTAEGNIGNLQTAVSTAQATANSAQQTATTARQQSYVFRYSSTALVDSSTNSNALLDNADNLKVGDKVIDSSGVLFSITAIDTQNSTFTIGTALIDLAQDSDVVHKSGNETVSGEKNFGGMLTFRGSYLGSEPSTSFRTCLELLGRFDTKDKSGFYFSKFRSNSAQGELSGSDAAFCTLDVLENGVRTNGILRFNLSAWSGSTPGTFSLYPKSGMNTNLGTTANKWTKFNGVEPSALGMPNLSNGIDISSYITAGNTHNEYTPLVNGWISVILKSTSGDLALFVYQGGMVNAQFGKTSLPNETDPCVMVSIPVNGGIVVNIDTKGSNSYVYSAKFFPCQGNV